MRRSPFVYIFSQASSGRETDKYKGLLYSSYSSCILYFLDRFLESRDEDEEEPRLEDNTGWDACNIKTWY